MIDYCRSVLFISIALFVFSCNKEEEGDPTPGGDYSDGVIVINGGNFSQNNGTLSFLKRGANDVVENIYNLVNGQVSLPAEDGRIEGYTEAGENGMVLFDHTINGEDQLVIVNSATFERQFSLGTPFIENPRDVVAVSAGKAYVTNWDALNPDWTHKDGFIAVVNPQTGEHLRKITVSQVPENMVLHQNKVYVGSAPWTTTKLTVVNTSTDEVIKSIDFENPPSPVGIDVNGKLWVKEANRFHRIDTSSDQIEATIPVGDDETKSIGVATFLPDGRNIVFCLSYSNEETNWKEVGHTFVADISSSSVSTNNPLLDRVFTSFGVDLKSRTIYAGVTPSFSQAGYVLRLNEQGATADSVRVEISPEGFFLK